MGGVRPKISSTPLELGSKARVLVSRTDRIGDLVLSLPVVRMLNMTYPQARIELLVQEYAAPIVRNQPGIAEVVIWDPQIDASDFISNLTARHYDAVICLYPRPHLARAFARAKIPVRVGTARRWYSIFFTHRVNVSRRKSGRHEKDLNLDLLAPVGIRPDYSLTPELSILPEAESSVPDEAPPSTAGDRNRPLVVVHPGDGGSAVNWSIQRYAELAKKLGRHGVDVVITGLPAERDRHLAEFATIVGEENVLSGRTDLTRLMQLLAGADVFVGGSTGPLHLAAALGTPVVGLYGPIYTTTPDRWGPCGAGHRVFVPDIPPCRCKVGSCRLGNCMDRIPLEDVLKACRDLAGRTGSSTCCQSINKTPTVSDVTPRER